MTTFRTVVWCLEGTKGRQPKWSFVMVVVQELVPHDDDLMMAFFPAA